MITKRKNGFVVFLALLVLMLLITGCTRSYEPIQEALGTPTIEGESDFPEALPSDMAGVIEAGAQTATALASGESAPPADEGEATATGEAVLTPSTEGPDAATPTATGTPPVIATTVVPPTSVVGRPATYTLKKGEFPYCVARRFNVDPKELLALNNISTAQAQTYQPGLTLSIPQSGAAFPPPRARHTHPTTYTVPEKTTVYGVACYFGDVDPADIISNNTIADSDNIAAGTTLSIP